jgi:hypothetical protein
LVTLSSIRFCHHEIGVPLSEELVLESNQIGGSGGAGREAIERNLGGRLEEDDEWISQQSAEQQ